MTDAADPGRFTRGSIAERQCRLSPPLQGLRRAVLRRFLQTGAAPTERWVRQTASDLGLPGSAPGELQAADAIQVAGGIVAVAYPESRHQHPLTSFDVLTHRVRPHVAR
jgi:hypothetical protein